MQTVFMNFIQYDNDGNIVKQTRQSLQSINICEMDDGVNCIDLSGNGLIDQDLLRIISAINKYDDNLKYFENITCINLSDNRFADNNMMDELFKLFGRRFRNLQIINLVNSGIMPSMYNDDKLKSLKLSASITWFESSNISESANQAGFVFQDCDEDEDIIFDECETEDIVINDAIDEDEEFDDDESNHYPNPLQIEYSVNVKKTK